MTLLPLAFSLSDTFTKIGAVAAFAALLGIAILALLVFSQARELKRLREWAGRAPERAADLEQRVTAAASARVQQQVTPPPAVRPIPRPAPVQARAAGEGAGPATRVVGAPAAAVLPGGQALTASGQPAPTPGDQGQPAAPLQPPAPGQPATPGQPGATPRPWSPQPTAPGQPAPAAAVPATPTAATPSPVRMGAPVGAPASAAGATQSRPAVAAPVPGGVEPPRPAPATAAAAAAATPRAPSPPSSPRAVAAPPSAAEPTPSPPVQPPSQSPPAQPAADAPGAQPAAGRPGAQSDPAPGAPRRPPPPPAATSRGEARAPITVEGPRSTYAVKRSPRRTVLLVAGAVIVVAAAAVAAMTALGGSSSGKAVTAASRTTVRSSATRGKSHPRKAASKPAAKTPVASPAETKVAVLNATETNGLAHQTAGELQQNGYSQAEALNGRPPGSGQVSVVEYASGHQAEAEGVAHSVDVTHVQPIEAAVTALAGSATVVVIVGEDKAVSSP
jgi:hypothetical protein